jgi:L-seryl-tRNA(Ser) seleniumtransferase
MLAISPEMKSSSKSHRHPFDHQIRQTGAKLVEVETREEMVAAINPKR